MTDKHYVFDDSYYHDGGDEVPAKGKKRDAAEKDKEEASKFQAKDFGIDPERGFNDDRGCTDMFCLMVFLAFVGSMIFLTSFAYTNGNPSLMMAPVDGDFNLCGFDEIDGAHKRLSKEHADFDKTKLFVTDLTFTNGNGLSGIKAIFKTSVCVKECPKDDSDITEYRTTTTNTGASLNGYKTHSLLNLCAPSVEELKSEYAEGWKIVKA